MSNLNLLNLNTDNVAPARPNRAKRNFRVNDDITENKDKIGRIGQSMRRKRHEKLPKHENTGKGKRPTPAPLPEDEREQVERHE